MRESNRNSTSEASSDACRWAAHDLTSPVPSRNPAAEYAAPVIEPLLLAIWARSKTIVAARIALLRAAIDTARRTGSLPEDQHEAAASAAHKLAGVLGTFGYPLGTDAARGIEMSLEAGPLTQTGAERLAPLVSALEQIVRI